MNDYEFKVFQELIKLLAGITIADDQKQMVDNRVSQRLIELKIYNVNDYVAYLHKNATKEIPFLISALTTHTTSFFREQDHFRYLEEKYLPPLLINKQLITKNYINVWSAACSSGEEVYSLAILLNEFVRKNNLKVKISILGTDIDIKIIQRAYGGIYKCDQVKELPPDIQTRYFYWGTGAIKDFVKVKEEIRSLVKFERKNLFSFPYFTNGSKFDLLFLRNVLIYFDKESIKRIINEMVNYLQPHGLLILGHTENILEYRTPFKLISNSIYSFKEDYIKQLEILNYKNLDLGSTSTKNTSTGSNLNVENAGGTANNHADLTKSNDDSNRPLLKEPRDPNSKIRVLIVDDSHTIINILKQIFNQQDGFHTVGEVLNVEEAEKVLAKEKVDVITLDINMEGKDGITYLEELSTRDHPPVVMISSISKEDALGTLRAFELGAFDYIEKPESSGWVEMTPYIQTVIREAANAGITTKKSDAIVPRNIGKKPYNYKPTTIKVNESTPVLKDSNENIFNPITIGQRIIAMGASTGGIVAIRSVLESFIPPTPPILIVQHIPPLFSAAFAERLSDTCKIKVKEAQNGEEVFSSTAYIAPGGKQMKVILFGERYVININDDPPVNKHRPSVDYLFNSLVDIYDREKNPKRVVGVLMTGMGADGARGLLNLRQKGAFTIAQDEGSCVVYGMPRVAKEIGAAIEIKSLKDIPGQIIKFAR